MPIRVRAKAQPARDMSPVSARFDFELPDIEHYDTFREVVKKLALYFSDVIELPSTFEQLRTTDAGYCVRVLVDHLGESCTNPAIVNALLALKWHYAAESEHRSLTETRSNACEIVAWRFLTRLSERQAVEFCLYEIPDPHCSSSIGPSIGQEVHDEEAGDSCESSPLLPRLLGEDVEAPKLPPGSSSKKTKLLKSLSRLTNLSEDSGDDDKPDPTAAFKGLNALEIAAIANAKRFLSQHVVQKIVTGIWNGDIVFWDSLSVKSVKKARYYNPRTSDPYSRLRVPKYLKTWEVCFFVIFLCLYYSVLIVRNDSHITITEIVLFVWIAAFFYDELSEWIDAGSIFYAADIWNVFDMIMILIGFIFAVLRIVGLVTHDPEVTEFAFDVLSLEALFMMPRICSILSLSPYWGTLIPCLKEMGKDFLKFMVLVVIIYFGFLTTFSLVGRDRFAFHDMTWILTKIFFGSSYVGFDYMDEIDPIFGPPLMIIFVTLTSILLTGSLTGMLSNSFSRVITHAKEEYLYVYSVYVLEASTSNRLTHFYPPFNLLALIIFRPLRFIYPQAGKYRRGRIILLRATHLPIVGAIKLYEFIRRKGRGIDEYAGFRGPRDHNKSRRPSVGRKRPSSGYSRQGRRPLSQESTIRKSDQRRQEDDIDTNEDGGNMEAQITELHQKIDQLTSMVMSLDAAQGAGKAADSPKTKE